MFHVINDHHGHLERCTISYFSFQCRNGMVEDWIRPLIHVHHVKHLTVVNSLFSFCGNNRPLTLNLPPETFSHPNLQTLILDQYNFETPDAFNNCGNLKTLTLAGIFAEIGALNAVLVSCPSLEVLVVDISKEQGLDLLESSSEKKRGGVLRIENRNLVCLYLSCPEVDGIHVSSPNLDVLTIEYVSCEIEKFVIANPRLQFSRNFWTTAKVFPHTSHCISCPHQEKKNIGHELLMGGQFMMSGHGDFVRRFGSLSVSVDLTNAKEVKMLQEILVTWPGEMDELEILFMKSNAPSKEVESSSGGTQETFWEETKPFFSAKFFVFTVWLSNFSGSKEEFALASRLITQGTVIMTMIIKPSSFLPSDMLVIEEAVAKLKELQGFPDLSIRMG
ncbi:unnamed protein product [Thlaspi arvense]|uniref:F-box/LRR-repeat protein 15/At3g58940/PEG3-like LRR domain-containing protein n=1 Tax=Thlaspi arvense TaxID=13288 RepID=A0AAU9TAN1_THLAR|nr:unnamed protein product [Thlaspi arvense]